MLRIANTNNLMGIVILGDYGDLHDLYDALCRINDLYYANLRDLFSEVTCLNDDTRNQASHLENQRQFFLRLISNICNAYQNNKNDHLENEDTNIKYGQQLYCTEANRVDNESSKLFEMTKYDSSEYRVEIPYPLAIYTMYSVWDYLNDVFLGEFPDNITVCFKEQFKNYHEKQSILYQDIGILMLLYSSFQKALINAVDLKTAENIFNYVNETVHTNNDILYTQALCEWFSNVGKDSTIQTKKAMITAMAYELYDCADEIDKQMLELSRKDYVLAIRSIDTCCRIPYPKYYSFNSKLQNYVSNLNDGFYKEDFGDFLQQEYT